MIAEITDVNATQLGNLSVLVATVVATIFIVMAVATACGVLIGKAVVHAIADLADTEKEDEEPDPLDVPGAAPAYCGHCGTGIHTDPEMELVVEHKSYLVYKCPDCFEKTLQATPAIRE